MNAGAAELTREAAAAHVPAVAYARVDSAGHLQTGASGVVDPAGHEAASAEVPFHAASVAKVVVALAALQVVERGHLGLDDELVQLVPELRGHPVTMRMLLGHAAGLWDDIPVLKRTSGALAPFVERYLADPEHWLPEAPGTRVAYSNVGYAVAALAVERATGTTFERWAEQNVFAAIGLARRATWSVEVSHGYGWDVTSRRFVPVTPVAHAVWPAVDLRASASTLGALLAAILKRDPRLLRPASFEVMERAAWPHASPGQRIPWETIVLGDRTVLAQEGEDDGASTAMLLDPVRRTGLVLLTNGDAFTSGDPARAEALKRLARRLLP